MLNYTFTLPSGEELNKKIEPIINEISSSLNITADSMLRYSLYLTVWEILINIMNHTDQTCGRTVHIRACWTDKEIQLQIDHENGCFDWRNAMSPTLPPHGETRGRGLYLIGQVSKHFSYDASGRTATITFDRV
ncbi:ATP-binding protein [Aneurinibacillus sp. Ricciae_BoGa-3]|uniref:ATP-binding protein n=1 Tax=Aneurinibacillus sp. Ricciae_BoGa-3 TaxID=3022697 RepID=UPI0023403EEB|nr:ATP-binding protein [Aneurinibacillus sp. Ricciae_BoGa-3]WCK55863.1 ATP-binding protein [Aneurinibacillus sp. Ricciae_BoGa-3]